MSVSKQTVAFSGEQLTTMLLQRLKATAEAVLGRRVRTLAITIPSDLHDQQNDVCFHVMFIPDDL